MTEKMPDWIKNNFVYNRVWNNIHHKNLNSTFLFIGNVGSGKSWGGMRFCYDLDGSFSADRVVYSVKDYLELLDTGNLKAGNAILFDEVAGSEQGADARSAMSRTNKVMNYIATTTRARKLILIYCAPFLAQIDSVLRKVGITGIAYFPGVIDRKAQMSKAHYYWAFSSAHTGKQYIPRPVVVEDGREIRYKAVWISKPPQWLIDDYEKKKMSFLNEQIHKWKERMIAEDAPSKTAKVSLRALYKRAVKDIGEFYDYDKEKVLVSLLRVKLNLTLPNAKMLASALNHDIKAGKIEM